jgi:hypothetical protein
MVPDTSGMPLPFQASEHWVSAYTWVQLPSAGLGSRSLQELRASRRAVAINRVRIDLIVRRFAVQIMVSAARRRRAGGRC